MCFMILSFADQSAAALFSGSFVRTLPVEIQGCARYRLRQIDAASRIEDLHVSGSNNFEALQGDRKGQWSIRINGARPVTVELALWFGRVFGQSPQCRIDLQAAL